MRIVFMGTPDFAVPSLQRLIDDGHTIAAVYTQPDKPKNRGMKLVAPPVKQCALAHGIPVEQPERVREEAVWRKLAAYEPELIVVAAYGKILPKEVLELPPLGCINVHSSLLPKYRGAAPINWAILNGETETGVTIMEMAQALDAGDILAQRATPIDPEENVETLHDRLAALGAELLSETVQAIGTGNAVAVPQNEGESTYAPMLSRELSPLDWNKSAKQLHNQVRGLTPWPACSTQLNGRQFKVYAASETGIATSASPGTVTGTDKEGILVACGDGTLLRITQVQAAGKRWFSVPWSVAQR